MWIFILTSSSSIWLRQPGSPVDEWLDKTDLHLLVAGTVFHYEFEFIHPFTDGSGSEIVRLRSAEPSLMAKALADVMGVFARTIERHLPSLQAKSVLMRTGEKKGGSWQVK